jgi:hypothetical protein
VTDRLQPDIDAAIVIGMASTAIPFARSREAQAERWLRILRLHGEAGAALQALGVSEGPLEASHETEAAAPAAGGGEEVVVSICRNASARAAGRGAQWFGTVDVLLAAIDFYGADFDAVLRAHGTDRDEVLERLALQTA